MNPNPVARLVCHEYGDAAVLVDVLADDYEDRWNATQHLGQALLEADVLGLVDVVASFQNVVIAFDPLVVSPQAICSAVANVGSRRASTRKARTFRVPVVYGSAEGPDLVDVAAELAIDPLELIDFHASGRWCVRFRGSPLGAPMMDGPRLASPVRRMSTPRARLAAGSVAISGFQSMIYPAASPGGWRVIGRTPVALFNLDRTPPVEYLPGDTFQFFPIAVPEWKDWVGVPVGSTPSESIDGS